MPYKPARPCKARGCPNLTDNGTGYCSIHKHLVPERVRGDSPFAHLYNASWHRARKIYLKANPLCVICGREATAVDHRIPHNGNLVLFWSRDNWQSMCKRHHDLKTSKEMNKRK